MLLFFWFIHFVQFYCYFVLSFFLFCYFIILILNCTREFSVVVPIHFKQILKHLEWIFIASVVHFKSLSFRVTVYFFSLIEFWLEICAGTLISKAIFFVHVAGIILISCQPVYPSKWFSQTSARGLCFKSIKSFQFRQK